MRQNSTRLRVPVRRQRRHRRGNGFSFFLGAFLVLIFALVCFFTRDILPTLETHDVIFAVRDEIIVSFLDIGQGDSILIRSAEHAVLIDGGEHRQRKVVLDYLSAAKISRLDYVVATHPHNDHIGGLVTVLRDIDVGRVVMPDALNNTDTFENFLKAIENNDIPVLIPQPGERLRAGIIDLEIIAPPPGTHSNLNNASIVLRMKHGQTAFLFTGDAETESERWMIESGANLQANVLKVGHHGSRTSTTEAFLYAVSPTVAVIQSGANNQFGHPHSEVLERLEAHGVSVYRTDQLGTIRMITNGQSIYFP